VTTLTVEPSLFDAVGGESTLDEIIVGVWEGLTAQRVVRCPICEEDMTPEYGVHALPIGGRCTSCGTVIA
jgi:hypothetical protein